MSSSRVASNRGGRSTTPVLNESGAGASGSAASCLLIRSMIGATSLARGVHEEEHELVAAEATGHVGVADGVLDGGRDGADGRVTDRVAVGVVDRLQAVDVQEHHLDHDSLPICRGERLGGGDAEPSTVPQAGEWIVVRDLFSELGDLRHGRLPGHDLLAHVAEDDGGTDLAVRRREDRRGHVGGERGAVAPAHRELGAGVARHRSLRQRGREARVFGDDDGLSRPRPRCRARCGPGSSTLPGWQRGCDRRVW